MNKSGLSPKARQIFEQMKEAEWQDLRNRLLYFGYRNYGGNDRRLGYHLDDAVQDAIVDVVTGVRRWPPVDEYGNEKEISLFVFLCQTVRSKISHVFTRKAREIQFEEVQGVDLPLDRLETLLGPKQSELERQIIYSEFSEQLLKLVSNDNTLTKFIKVLIETPDLRPQEIAPLLGISMKEMRNAQKRLSRRLKALRRRNNDKHSQ
jgi:DNA-directed RNA polymerase specialized sigma24 family protein